MEMGSPNSGSRRSLTPKASGSPTCTGAPCIVGYRPEIATARGDLARPVGSHADDHRTGERPQGDAISVRHVHRDVPALVEVREAQSRGEQRPLEGEAAADQERHQVVAPVRPYVRGLVYEIAALVDPVPRNVSPQVSLGRHHPRHRRTRVRDLQDGAGSRVTDAELQEVEREVLGQYDEVGLHVPPREAAGRSGVLAVAYARANLFQVRIARAELLLHRFPPYGRPLPLSCR